jgi:hypothetical protein
MTTSGTVEYALGASEAEWIRVLVQCEIHRREAERLIDRIGVAPGWRTIDVGCGPLGLLEILANRVGPHGSVTGLEHSIRWYCQLFELRLWVEIIEDGVLRGAGLMDKQGFCRKYYARTSEHVLTESVTPPVNRIAVQE